MVGGGLIGLKSKQLKAPIIFIGQMRNWREKINKSSIYLYIYVQNWYYNLMWSTAHHYLMNFILCRSSPWSVLPSGPSTLATSTTPPTVAPGSRVPSTTSRLPWLLPSPPSPRVCPPSSPPAWLWVPAVWPPRMLLSGIFWNVHFWDYFPRESTPTVCVCLSFLL